MKKSPTTLFGVYQKFASKNKTSFSDWCAFVAWVKKFNPDIDVLNALDELTPEAYEAVCNPELLNPPASIVDPPTNSEYTHISDDSLAGNSAENDDAATYAASDSNEHNAQPSTPRAIRRTTNTRLSTTKKEE